MQSQRYGNRVPILSPNQSLATKSDYERLPQLLCGTRVLGEIETRKSHALTGTRI